MRKTAWIVILVPLYALLSGCALLNAVGDRTVVTVINNARYVNLDILVDDQVICEKLKPGQHFGVQVGFYRQASISVIGRDPSGRLIGAASASFYGGEYREYNYNYSGYYGGSGSLSQSWNNNTPDLRRRE